MMLLGRSPSVLTKWAIRDQHSGGPSIGLTPRLERHNEGIDVLIGHRGSVM